MTTSNTTTKTQTTITTITSAIRTATTSRGELLNVCREYAKNISGRKAIAQACNVLIDEHRELLAKEKGFNDFAHYEKALNTRIDAKAKGAKNELRNAKGIKCGHKTNKAPFYHVVNSALHDTITNSAKDGYKLTLQSDYTFIVESRAVTAKVKDSNDDGKNKTDNDTTSANKTDSEQLAASSTSSNISNVISALEALNDTDLSTLANAIVHGSNDALVNLSKAIALVKEQEKANKEKTQAITTKIDELQLKADKHAINLKLAKDKNMPAKTIKARQAALKATNSELAGAMNEVKTMTLSASQY